MKIDKNDNDDDDGDEDDDNSKGWSLATKRWTGFKNR